MSTKITLDVDLQCRQIRFCDSSGAGYSFRGASGPEWATFRRDPDAVEFQTAPIRGQLSSPLKVRIQRLAEDEFSIRVQAEPTSEMKDPIEVVGPLVMESVKAELAFPYYGEGLIIKTCPPEWDNSVLDTRTQDMPLVILTDGRAGCMLLHDMPPDDGEFAFRTAGVGGMRQLGVVPRFLPQFFKFGYDRALRIFFVAEGGYVALLKRYRRYLAERGYIVTLREKAEWMKDLERLRGAISIWGNVPGFFEKCRAAGIERAIVGMGGGNRDLADKTKALGYLASQYHCYHYCRADQPEGHHLHGHPERTTVGPDGKHLIVWVHHGKDGDINEYDRCSLFHAEYARRQVAQQVKNTGLNCVFADISGATGVVECFSPEHPHTREEDRAARSRLFDACGEFGIVVGTEHGRWWTPKNVAYHEGMMSMQWKCPWSRGYLVRPAPDDDLRDYYNYGLSPVRRLPLFELVFHDCVVDYWYWEDTTDWLHHMYPEFTDIKDAINALTGTPPMVWIGNLSGMGQMSGFGLPEQNWERFLATAKDVLPIHARVFHDEMVLHEWLTSDRLVQRCKFSSGIETYANFGAEPYEVSTPNGVRLLGLNGFLAIGDGFVHHRGAGPASVREAGD